MWDGTADWTILSVNRQSPKTRVFVFFFFSASNVFLIKTSDTKSTTATYNSKLNYDQLMFRQFDYSTNFKNMIKLGVTEH